MARVVSKNIPDSWEKAYVPDFKNIDLSTRNCRNLKTGLRLSHVGQPRTVDDMFQFDLPDDQDWSARLDYYSGGGGHWPLNWV